MRFLYPVPENTVVTQSYAEHVQRAVENGWAWKPGMAGEVKYYPGIDWGSPMGTPVQLAQAGEITEIRFDTYGYGWHVRAKHADGYLSIYAHLSQIYVKAGDRLEAGHVVGRSGNSGYSTGPHLHFELRLNGVPVDPQPLLSSSLEGEGEPGPAEPSGRAIIRAGWNLRDGPGGLDIGTTDADVRAEVLERRGDWVNVRISVWVHKDGVG